MAGNDDPYFGYDYSWLSAISEGKRAFEVGGRYDEPTYYSQTWGKDQPSDPTIGAEETPGPDDSDTDIEMINLEIKGEQPGTADDLSLHWGQVGLMLAGLQLQLRTQTQTMAEGWDSPAAKEVYLSKVGEMLAYLDVWQYASSVNSVNLATLAGIMREGQSKMKALYAEFQTAYEQSAKGPLKNAEVRGGINSYEEEQDRKAGKLGDRNRTDDEVRADYSRRARVLASDLATEYAPVISELRNGHAMIMDAFNAHIHPGAFGDPVPDMPSPNSVPTTVVSAPGSGPGSAPPVNPPGNAPNLPPHGAPNAPADGPPVAPNTAPQSIAPTDVPNVPPVGAGGGPTMSPPVVQPPPVPSLSTLAPFLAQSLVTPNLLQNLSKNGPNVQPPPTPDALGGGTPGGAPPLGSADLENMPNAMTAQNGMYPPGTISPPPGGTLSEEQLRQLQQGGMPGSQLSPPPGMGQSPQSPRDKQRPGAVGGRGPSSANGQQPGSQFGSPPPGSSQMPSRQGQQAGGAGLPGAVSPETAAAFQPPPSTTPSVLGNDKQKRTRPGSPAESVQNAYQGLGGATPPVLGNPRREGAGKGASKPRSMRKSFRRKKVEPQEIPDFLSGLPAATAPILEGRVAPEPVGSVGEVPSSLLAPKHALPEPDKHARPVEHADRTTRVAQPQPADAPAAAQNAWEVENPGGPMVAGHTPTKHHQAEPSTDLNNRSTT
ncbi:hypothetical protein [Amycolatopsis sp.]|uniref:hypothetical protein n=1 Tax=Amycolatopsis sp. TaxID=37632 RepID=UPI002BEF91F7|nr:hypothetical protein [Amycolatopsis sp.]HVV11756.1 hypothetical protein [Amycolatopsis sp.]